MYSLFGTVQNLKIGYLETSKPYSGPSYEQFMIFMYAILLFGQLMATMQPNITIYDLVFVLF